LVGTTSGVRIESMEIFAGFLAIQLREQATARVRVIPLPSHLAEDNPYQARPEGSQRSATPAQCVNGHGVNDHGGHSAGCYVADHGETGGDNSEYTKSGYFLDQPSMPSTCTIGDNPDIASPFLRYECTSLVSPRAVHDLDLQSGHATVIKLQQIRGEYDESKYCTTLEYVASHDGRQVPMSIVSPRDMSRNGSAPCLLYGYGAYEYSVDPAFSATRLSLLERGFSFAIAHVRGGGELGRRWYDEGKLASKTNTFHDFVACARYLVDNGWTHPSRLVGRGGSAGGMLMGAAANMAPELFRAIVAEVPFVDCLTTMMDSSLPLTITEWEEWGNPLEDRNAYLAMKAYSPYDNVRQGVQYPDILATAGLSDPRVGYFEPLKWVQKLRAACPQSRILLMTNMDGGHMGPSGRYAAWEEEAIILSFIIDSVNR
ncbi:MAG: prolyl oligopeptidase family serine peptidase, partial [Acidimicrobiales bacterium]